MNNYKEIKNIFNEYGSLSTAYGIPNLLRSRKLYQKIIWLIFIIISTSASSWFVYDTIVNYFDFKVVTLIETIYEQPTDFPTVTICPFNTKILNDNNLSSLIYECFFSYDLGCQSNPDNYFESFYTFYGKCYRFNSGKNIKNDSIPLYKSTTGGVDDCFSLGLKENIPISIWIHNKSSPPKIRYTNNHYSNRIFISPNTYTQISIDKIVEKKLTGPYNMCLNDINDFNQNKTIINYIYDKNQIYEQDKCVDLCFELDYLDTNQCNCLNPSLGNVIDDCIDFTKDKYTKQCTIDYMKNFYSNKIIDKCSKYCPLECDSITYNFQISPLVFYNNNTRMKIFFKSLKYTFIKQEPKMFVMDLVSNIGGTFGLFIGVSFITLVELSEILIEVVIFLFQLKK